MAEGWLDLNVVEDLFVDLNKVKQMKRNWFLHYISSEKVYYLQAIIASVFINIFALITSLYIMVVYDRIIPNSALSSLLSIAVGVGFIVFMDFSMKMLRGYFLDKAGRGIENESSADVFQKIVDFDLSKTPKSSGVLVSVVREFETFREFFNSATLALLVDLPFIFVFLVVISVVSGPVVWVPGTAVILVIFFGLVLQPFFRSVAEKSHKGLLAKQSVLGEMISGLETVKTVSGSKYLKSRWMDAVEGQSSTGIKAGCCLS